MKDLENIITKINELMESMKIDNEKNLAGNKAAGARARKTSVELGKQLKVFRVLSVKANKK